MWALERPLPFDERHDPLRLDADTPRSNTSEAEFLAMVERSKEYIRAGDIFQVVLSQRFEADFPLPAFALYRSLRRVNPAPFLCYLDFEDFQIVCSSPGDPGAGARRHGDDPPDRRHAAARRDRSGGQAPRRRAPRRPEGARRAPDAARPRAQRRRPRLDARQRQGDRQLLPRALQPGDAHRLERRGPARPAPRRARRARRRLPVPARSRARPRCGRWRSSTSWRRRSAGLMPAASAISAPTARWTPASCCAPRS